MKMSLQRYALALQLMLFWNSSMNKNVSLLAKKHWGVFSHQVIDRDHPLISGVSTRFDIPHSRFNEVSESQFDEAGVKILAKSSIGVHLAVSPDLFRIVFFQGHPEYDTISLLKEYKREVALYLEDKER